MQWVVFFVMTVAARLGFAAAPQGEGGEGEGGRAGRIESLGAAASAAALTVRRASQSSGPYAIPVSKIRERWGQPYKHI